MLLFFNEIYKVIDYLNEKTTIKTKKTLAEFDDIMVIFGCFLLMFATDIKLNLIDISNAKLIKKRIYEFIRITSKTSSIDIHFLQIVLLTKYSLMPQWSCFNAVEVLIECGAKVMSIDHCKNTPLHAVCSLPVSDDLSEEEKFKIINLLLNHGAHIDARNKLGHTPLELLGDKKCNFICNPVKHITLQCLASQIICKYNIPYNKYVPKDVANFIRFH
jgi:hypothetical protein